MQPEKQSELLFGEGEEKICHAIVTPDGKWIDGPWIYGSTKNSEQQQELEAWLTRFTEILEQNKDAALFLAECHN